MNCYISYLLICIGTWRLKTTNVILHNFIGQLGSSFWARDCISTWLHKYAWHLAQCQLVDKNDLVKYLSSSNRIPGIIHIAVVTVSKSNKRGQTVMPKHFSSLCFCQVSYYPISPSKSHSLVSVGGRWMQKRNYCINFSKQLPSVYYSIAFCF